MCRRKAFVDLEIGKRTLIEMKGAVQRFAFRCRSLWRLVRRSIPHVHTWTVKTGASPETKLVYTWRECICGQREVQNKFGRTWSDERATRFSVLQCFEQSSRRDYELARDSLGEPNNQ